LAESETRRVLVVETDGPIRRELEELLAPLGHSDWVIGIPIPSEARPATGDSFPWVVAESESMREALSRVRRVAAGRSTVLVTGQTGTGKDVIAGLLHQLSPRASGPFVKVSCAALPETLLESELFGHERGAFTGADRSRVGRFEQASEGTLFLDEIGEMSLATQVKLLRVLEEREFQRLGSVDTRRTEARIVAATNRDLAAAVREGRFRADLYFRLDVISITLAPLCDRPEDVEPLAHLFLAEIAREGGMAAKPLRDAALRRIRRRPWRGNVRELRNALEYAFFLGDGDFIEADDLPEPTLAPSGPGGSLDLPPEGISLQEVERELVLRALEQTDYVQKEAARLLQISRRKLNYMIRRMGVTHPSWRKNRGPSPGVEPRQRRDV
jgi:DNA-binding NtrC family response regulator